MKCKNPYLLKAKNGLIIQDLVKNLFDAYWQLQAENLFDGFLEDRTIFVGQEKMLM